MKILVTGAAGFIGMHVADLLLSRGDSVVGIDNINDYYDPKLKLARLAQLESKSGFSFMKGDVADNLFVEKIFSQVRPDRVIHLAAQAGVRYSLKNPQAYIQSNLVGFGNILEACRQYEVSHLVYASSSSVYGLNATIPFSTSHNVDHPASLYAATKKANELMAHSYSHLYGLPTTGLRYFTVYGPWGRPDMAPWLFLSSILEDRPIDVYNMGKMRRDFTFVDDIALGTVLVSDKIPAGIARQGSADLTPGTSTAPFRIYNIGNHDPIELMKFINIIESAAGKSAIKNFLPMQDGDVVETFADVSELQRDTGFSPSTSLEDGIERFVHWYKNWTK